MPETPEELYDRAANSLRMPDLETWDSFPFEGTFAVRSLQRPLPSEPPREGQGGRDCEACAAPDDRYLWMNERWRVKATDKPSGLPIVLFLEPRAHIAEPADLSEEMAAEFGILSTRLDAAVCAVDNVSRTHICHWGEGAEHLHWWFMGRPTGMYQLMSSFAELWDEVLPPVPDDIWRENIAIVTSTLADVP